MRKKSPEFLRSAGRSATLAGRAVGKQLLTLYRSIDPDVTRHLLQMPLLSYSLLSSRTQKVEPIPSDGYRPLIFVHGLGGTRGDFLPMSGFLWLQGRKRSYRSHFERGQSVAQMAEALARFIRRVMQVTGERKVDIVAHSLGGVVSRLAIHEHRLSRNVGTLITLGSPHGGTHSARFANTALARELRPDSELMRKLGRRPWSKSVRGITFWSRNDLLIVPAESAALRGTRSVDMTPFTHYSYLIDPKSWAAVRKSLDGVIGRRPWPSR